MEKARKLQISDPLLQNPEAFETATLGPEEEVVRVTVDFDGVDFKHYREDPETGEPARIEITMVNADVRRMRERLGLTRVTSSTTLSRRFSEYGFNRRSQGFCLVRGSREIANGQTLGIFTKRAKLNYFHGEIRFPACLDRWFGIEVNKSEFRLNSRLNDKIRALCQTITVRFAKQTDRRLASLRGARRGSRAPTWRRGALS